MNILYADLGRAIVKEEFIEGNKFQSIVNFYWLSYGSIPPAQLLLGKKESFLFSVEVVQ